MIKPRRNTDPEMSDINITSLIDILFVILIVFMISASGVVRSTIGIKLPSVQTQEKANPAEIEVSIVKDGTIYVGNQKLNKNNIEMQLKKLASDKHTNKVVIKADGDIDYGTVMEVMDRARVAGLEALTLSVDVQDGKAPPK
ncbi:MAG: biopolymer transporter ExbD [Firmicutes bacterium]|nr:biopolymer transporter ExbD [Bacillota bacterium]